MYIYNTQKYITAIYIYIYIYTFAECIHISTHIYNNNICHNEEYVYMVKICMQIALRTVLRTYLPYGTHLDEMWVAEQVVDIIWFEQSVACKIIFVGNWQWIILVRSFCGASGNRQY